MSSIGFSDDPDSDGIPNGIERYFGTHPARLNIGLALVPGSQPPAFRHSRTPSPPATLAASFQWSVDLEHWHTSGSTAGGTTIHLEPDTLDDPGPLGDLIEVVPRIEGTSPRELFLRMNVEQTGE